MSHCYFFYFFFSNEIFYISYVVCSTPMVCTKLNKHFHKIKRPSSSCTTNKNQFRFVCYFLYIYTGSSISSLELATHSFPPTSPSRCSDVGLWGPCICTLEMCIGWYPCGLKYCKGKPENNNGIANNASFRCGYVITKISMYPIERSFF